MHLSISFQEIPPVVAMESLIDIVTTTFQAVLALCVIFTAGYAYNGKNATTVGVVSSPRTSPQSSPPSSDIACC